MLLKQMRRGVLLIICGISLATAAVTVGQAQTAPDEWTVPEVKALVFVQAVDSDTASVDLQMTGSLTDEQARQVINRAASVGGWSPGQITVKREVFQSGRWWEDMTGKKAEPQRLTVAQFQASGLVNEKAGQLAVKEFVQALRDSSPVRVVYKVGEQFAFSGPDDEDFEGFHIAHYQSDGMHTFDAVASGAPVAAASQPAEKAAGKRPFPWLGVTLCGAAVALAGGAGVWKWRLGKSQHKTRDERGDNSGT